MSNLPKAYSYNRFSTKEQEKGDSERRQSDPDEKIAKKLKLPLDDTLHLTDKGLSAYTGDNLTRGALGEFIKLVDEGKIAKGSILIMENLDRLTRLPVLEAEYLYTGILLRDIGIYTWMDKELHNKENYDVGASIQKSISLDQGNKESDKKSDRIGKAWANLRADVISGKRKISSNCPLWLRPIPDPDIPNKFVTIDFEPIPERVAVIKQIFEMKRSGKGSDTIARELNSMKGIWKPQGKIINKETKKRRQSAWYTSLVDLYLNNNRKLLGELQLYRYTKVNGKRKNIPEGDPIQKYYGEAVIDLDLFNSVQEIIRTNAKKDGRGGGRGDLVNNLFNHMAVCSGCGSPMRYMNKGNELRTADQFKCANALIGLCNFPKLHYLEVEKEVLTFCKGLEVADIIPNKENTLSELSLLQNQLQAKEGEIESIEKKMENMKADTEKPMSYEFKKALGESYELKKIELDKLIAERDEIQNQIALLSVNGKQTEEHIKSIRELIDLMDNMRKDESKKQELLNLRLNLRSQLRRLIKKISVSSGGLMIYFQSGQMRRIMFNEKPSQFKVWDRNRPPKSMLK